MKNILVLNKYWSPIGMNNLCEAISKVFNERANIVDNNYIVYDWMKWMKHYSNHKPINNYFYTGNIYICKPKIIVLKNYDGFHHKKVKLNRKNIFIRDKYTCQYCGYKGKNKTLNIDHVIPVSQGGKTNWENIVVSCFTCNQKKSNKLLSQLNMKLINKPSKPTWVELHKKTILENYDYWKGLLGKI